MSRKGEHTREQILDHAVEAARRGGLESLSIGGLAEATGMSKSGLFAHFGSKEALAVAVLQHASDRFVADVVRPGLQSPRGEPRLRTLFEGWLRWGLSHPAQGGCLFVAAAVELDGKEGPARDRLVAIQRDWMDLLATVVRSGQLDGRFSADEDPEQIAGELYGMLLFAHHARMLLGDAHADVRALKSFEALLRRLRPAC